MRSLFDACTPREDVLTGNLLDTQFAADLQAVVSNARGTPSIYREATTFFAYTYLPNKRAARALSGGLRTLH